MHNDRHGSTVLESGVALLPIPDLHKHPARAQFWDMHAGSRTTSVICHACAGLTCKHAVSIPSN